MTNRTVQKEKKLDDGLHQGIIVEVLFRTKPYEYCDVVIELADKYRIKAGFADFVSKTSKLGLLLERFGATLEDGQDLEIESYLVGKKCQFITTTSGKFANVVPDSVKHLA